MSIPQASYNSETRRCAVMDCAWRVLSLSEMLEAVGLCVIGSLTSVQEGIIRLIVAGDALPDECVAEMDGHLILKHVTATFETECHGLQRLHRIRQFELIDDYTRVDPLTALELNLNRFVA